MRLRSFKGSRRIGGKASAGFAHKPSVAHKVGRLPIKSFSAPSKPYQFSVKDRVCKMVNVLI